MLRKSNLGYKEELANATYQCRHYAKGTYPVARGRAGRTCLPGILTIALVLLCSVNCEAGKRLSRQDDANLTPQVLFCSAVELLTLDPFGCDKYVIDPARKVTEFLKSFSPCKKI